MKRKPPKSSSPSNLSEREKAINALNICKEEELSANIGKAYVNNRKSI